MLKEALSNYRIEDVRKGLTILENSTPTVANDLVEILSGYTIENEQIIAGGGGHAEPTTNLRDRFNEKNWDKKIVEEQHIVDGMSSKSVTHEIDHWVNYRDDYIGLEIEWNNKPPFFDRDLSNFSNLHRLEKLTIGIIITRGPNLGTKLQDIFDEWVQSNLDENREFVYSKLNKQRGKVQKQVEKNPQREIEYISKALYQSKYGQSTTHWDTLMKTIANNNGYPAPLVLIGIEPGVFN